MYKPIIKFPDDQQAPLNIIGEGITILLSKPESLGNEIFFQEGPEGSGPNEIPSGQFVLNKFKLVAIRNGVTFHID